MFTTKQLVNLFSNSKTKDTVPETSLIVEIMKYVNINIFMDGESMAYSYRINLFDLSKSGIPDETIYMMIDDGWSLTKDRKFIENFVV